MTPETLADILHRAGVGTWHNSVGPHHETHLEEARALLREPEFAALDGLREALNMVGECRVLGPHPHAFVGPHRFNEAGPRDVLDEIEDLASHPDGRTPKQVIDAIRKKARAALQAEPARAEEGAGT